MKIAFVAYDFPEYCIRIVNEMTEAGEVLLMLPENTTQDYLDQLDSRVRFAPFFKPRLRQPARQVVSAAQIVRRLRKFQPDVVHFQNGHLYFNLAMPLIKRYPLVVTIHDVRQHVGDKESRLTPQRIMDFGFRRADQVIVHGKSLADNVAAELAIPVERIHRIPHVAIGEPTQDRAIVDEGQRVLFFGRIWEYKGLEYLIRAEPQVTAEFPQVKFIIGGRGEAMDRYRQCMVHPERFEIHNDWISDEQRADMFATASLVVLPYIEASQSGVIPIAYAYGKPVIATRTGGLPDMVEHGRTGLLVAPRDVDGLAQAILQLLRDPIQRQRMGAAGKEKLVRECAPSVVARQTLAVYRQAIASRGKLAPCTAQESLEI